MPSTLSTVMMRIHRWARGPAVSNIACASISDPPWRASAPSSEHPELLLRGGTHTRCPQRDRCVGCCRHREGDQPERLLVVDQRRGVGQVGLTHHGRHRRSEEHTSELQSRGHLVCRLLLEKKKKTSKEGKSRK